MANEHTGIVEEARARFEYQINRSEAIRDRLIKAGPASPNGPYAQLRNPFMRKPRPPFFTIYSAENYGRRLYDERNLGKTPEEVIQAVALVAQLTVGEIIGYRQQHRLTKPRHVAMWAVDRYCPQYSYIQVGQIFRRDHTTVIRAINVVNERLMSHRGLTCDLVTEVRDFLAL